MEFHGFKGFDGIRGPGLLGVFFFAGILMFLCFLVCIFWFSFYAMVAANGCKFVNNYSNLELRFICKYMENERNTFFRKRNHGKKHFFSPYIVWHFCSLKLSSISGNGLPEQ